jgi:hypothetical protein
MIVRLAGNSNNIAEDYLRLGCKFALQEAANG